MSSNVSKFPPFLFSSSALSNLTFSVWEIDLESNFEMFEEALSFLLNPTVERSIINQISKCDIFKYSRKIYHCDKFEMEIYPITGSR